MTMGVGIMDEDRLLRYALARVSAERDRALALVGQLEAALARLAGDAEPPIAVVTVNAALTTDEEERLRHLLDFDCADAAADEREKIATRCDEIAAWWMTRTEDFADYYVDAWHSAAVDIRTHGAAR